MIGGAVVLVGFFMLRGAKASTGKENALTAQTAWHFPEGAVPFAQMFQTAEQKYNLPKFILAAIAERESDFRADVTGASGEQGLMQINKNAGHPLKEYDSSWFEWSKGDQNFYYPEVAIDYAGWYLRRLMDSLERVQKANNFPQNTIATWANVLVCYNWGIGNFLAYMRGEKDISKAVIDYADEVTHAVGLPMFKPKIGLID